MKIAILVISAYLLLVAPAAHAYIDPGTGGMLLQIIVGTVLGITVAGRKYIALISRKLFGKKEAKKEDAKPEEKKQ